GRPSTYASILSTIVNDRGYVRRERRALVPTELGMAVTDKLKPYFPEIMDVEFTAHMEDHLDKIQEAERTWVEKVTQSYQLVERRSRRGRTFFGRSAYPNCKFVLWQRPVPEPCPKCAAPFTTERAVRGRVLRRCVREGCDFEREVETSVA